MTVPSFTPLFGFRRNDSLSRRFTSVTEHVFQAVAIEASLSVSSCCGAELPLHCGEFKTQ